MAPASWHAHELLFGYAPAVVAGFLLTTVPNWTGRPPLRGWGLAGLAGIWLAGRVALGGSDWIGAGAAAVIDCGFLAALVAVTLREIVAAKNWRNLPVIAAPALLVVANALDHAANMGVTQVDAIGQRLAIAGLVALLTLIGGRVVPSFTRNWLAYRGVKRLPAKFGLIDRAAIALTVAALGAWAFEPFGATTSVLLFAAAAVQAVRLARWQGWQTLAEPLLWVLHVGYLWIPLGLAMLGAAATGDLAPAAANHALTIGAIGTMTLAIMTRATLGHTGRELVAGRVLTVAFLLIQIAAVARIAATTLGFGYDLLLALAAIAWVGAYLAFVWACAPMLLRPRVGP